MVTKDARSPRSVVLPPTEGARGFYDRVERVPWWRKTTRSLMPWRAEAMMVGRIVSSALPSSACSSSPRLVFEALVTLVAARDEGDVCDLQ